MSKQDLGQRELLSHPRKQNDRIEHAIHDNWTSPA
jgi:hypothetical protein